MTGAPDAGRSPGGGTSPGAGPSPRTAFLGPPGTFCETAMLRLLGPDAGGVPMRSEREAILAVERGEVDGAVVPIENALEGAVTGTLDALALEVRRARIAGEVVVPVELCLVVPPGSTLADVREVVSHPQPLGQARRFLAERLPGVREVAATSTAAAVREVAGGPAGRAAIGPRRAAELYGGAIVVDDVADEPGNATRFVHVTGGAPPAVTAGVRRRTTVVFHGGGDATPGWLVACLGELAGRGVNLTKIESRPRKVGLGHYLFVVDLDGGEDEPAVAEALTALAVHCEEVRVLGSYAAAPR